MHSDITFFTTFKAFDEHSDAIGQQSAVYSWLRERLNFNPILAIGRDAGVEAFCKTYKLKYIPGVERALERGLGSTHPMLRSIFKVALDNTTTGYSCLINSDIIVTPNFHRQLGTLLFQNKDPFVTGIRHDISLSDPVIDERGYLALCKRSDTKVHRSGGTDYFAFPVTLGRRILAIMPDYVMGAAAWDNWLHWAAIKLSKTPICTLSKPKILHPRHGYRQLGLKTAKSIYEHPAVRHNMKIYKASKNKAGISGGRWKYS